MKNFFSVLILMFISYGLPAIAQENIDPDKRTDWWGDADGYLNQQAKVSLDLVNQALKDNRPTVNDPLARKMAFQMIDNVLHDVKAPYRPAVQSFFHERIENAIKEIKTEKVKEGAVIWKLYNHAFVVKTSSVTIGFDIQRGTVSVEDFRLNKELMQQLADAVDVLFISHYHDDHADISIAEMFLAQNKPVITPPDLWKDSPIYNKILHLQRDADKIQKVSLPLKGFELKVVNYPGHQEETILNNVYLIYTPEGITFLHTGDQSNSDDFKWIDHVGENYKIDVVMINSWSVYPDQRLAKGFRPRLMIPGHENELGHTIDHREPYWLNDKRLGDKTIFPWIQMVWGEKYHYIPEIR